TVEMNPILLKPSSDVGSQVIVKGEAVGNMPAAEYRKKRKEFIPEIKKCFERLAEKYDIIVIEGAGSPAEINLKDDDIVNMGMAKIADSPVLLVGDIDRGGVFAQLIGTVDLLEDDEKARIKGLIINKFRGDKNILKSGIDMLEEKAKKPVFGVIPYADIDIDDEDSLSEKFERKSKNAVIDIVVIKLPRISNHTDFDVFERIDGVGVRYVRNVYELREPDMIIIPGTKSTVGDMIYLRENGLEARIKQLAAKGKPIFGICGGFQMLGESIEDIDGTEKKGEYRAMGLLPIKTVFKEKKTRTRVRGKFRNTNGIFEKLNGICFEGYEIHNGVSEMTDDSKNMTILCSEYGEKNDGANKGNIYGSYVHGIFDSKEVTEAIINALAENKGIDIGDVKYYDTKSYKEKQYDMLADVIRENIDMDRIYKVVFGE
ncbi:MAG: cobyric acid synthase, partial [Firmicutes bacterium]|nr:cobyric acid synthase [Bacillota bacterium]